MRFDVLFVHPPALYDFRERVFFPGPIAHTVADSTPQFIIFPVGLLSMAEHLNRNGCKVAIDNLGERMVSSETFNAESHLKSTEAKIFAIDLHWCTHSQGAVEVAKVCKRLHPGSFVLLGGLTATRFNEEILLKYPFIDGVIRGEAEDPLLQLLQRLETRASLSEVPSLTHREGSRILQNKLHHPCPSLDELDFTRLDLVTPWKAPVAKRASIPVCRGCLHNCVTCGGSAYSYEKLFGRQRPAFRSPEKIAEDLNKLDEQGVEVVFIFQDPRMGGRKYWNQLLRVLKTDRSKNIHTMSMELFEPASAEFLQSLVPVRQRITLTMSPESGNDRVRQAHGRPYTNTEIRSTARLCRRLGLRLTVFFMIGLAEETHDTIEQTVHLWEEFYAISHSKAEKPPLEARGAVRHAAGSMILLDPGSLAFDYPEKYGYKLLFKNLNDYVEGMLMPSWHQWISYETNKLSRTDVASLTLHALWESTRVREEFGVYRTQEQAAEQYFFTRLQQTIIEEMDKAMQADNVRDREHRLRTLKEALADQIELKTDPYGYRSAIQSALHESVGLLDPYQ